MDITYDESSTTVIVRDEPPPLTLDGIIAAWLHAKQGRSGSKKTARAYGDTLGAFRVLLQSQGADLDSDPRLVALAAQGWAGRDDPAPATFNQRLSILSSFYGYARKQALLIRDNPISFIDRRSAQSYANAEALTPHRIAGTLKALKVEADPTSQRDYVLIRVAVSTGRRVNELASLRWRDVRTEGERVTLTFPRAKGGKVMRDTLSAAVSKAFLSYLHAVHGPQLTNLAPNAAIWMSLDDNQHKGNALSTRSLQRISVRRVGVHFHALRHTFARGMEDAGAKVSEIQAKLGHASLQTTGRYLAALRSDENPHADALDRLFGDER